MSKISGLTQAEVDERMRAGMDNKPVKAPSKSTWQIICSNTFTYFNGIFVFIAVILFMVKSYRDLTFLGVILANTLIGIIQELRSKAVLDKLTVLNAQKSVVIRDGKREKISVNELVMDDIVVFSAGDQIPADAKVISGEVSVNEALLTGEADEIIKKTDDELLSGSFIVSGECYARLTKVGDDSYISKLTLEARAIKTGEQSEIIRSLNKLLRIVGIALIPIGIILFLHQHFVVGLSMEASVQAVAAAIIGMIPEGLFLLASVSLAISAMRLALNKVLVHEMKCIETLARVDVLCVDKTGTITSGEMSVEEVVELDNDFNKEVLSAFVQAQKADNVTMEALKAHFTDKSKIEKEKVLGFSSKYKYSAVKFKKEGNYILGAPEFILGEKYDEYKDKIERYNKKGYRVLLFCRYGGKLDGEKLRSEVIPKALVVLADAVRDTAPQTFKYFEEQGVEVKVISGDNPLTVAEVAKRAGIKNTDKYIDTSGLTDKELAEAAVKYTVFGRVLPEQKRKLVKALQAAKHTVAMTGDGVNDVLALKDADCSIAMASGSDAAIHAAQLVLLESDFSKMPSVVREGRRVVNNLERSGSLFIVKNIFSFMAAIITVIFSAAYPLLSSQVSLISMWAIGVPSFFLAQMPNEDLIHGRFMANILKKAIPGGLTAVLLVFAADLLADILKIPEGQVSTGCTMVFAAVGIIYLYRICKPFDWYRKLVWGGCLGGLLICLFMFRWFFRLSSDISLNLLLIVAVLSILAVPLLRGFELGVEKFFKKVVHWA
ncbi:cation-translocating P-type ATPase [Candidatus Saccharibacteria bacterium]|nr:cation-translocating P-type ATPase [Candidatus Saccharibacteria bacterium]